MNKVFPLLMRWPPAARLWLGAGLMVSTGLVDRSLPWQLNLSLVYVLEVMLLACLAGLPGGLFGTVLAVGLLAVDDYSHPATQSWGLVAWDTVMRLGAFALLAVVTWRWLRTREDLEARVKARTAELEHEAGLRCQHEKDLQAALQRFDLMARHIPAVFWLSDPPGEHLEYVSPASEQVFGKAVSPGPARRSECLENVHPDDREVVRQGYPGMRDGRIRELHYRVVRPDGVVRWVRDRLFPVRDSEGRVQRIAGLSEDVTEQHAAEEGWRQSVELFEQVADQAQQVIWVFSARTGRPTYVSRGYQEIWGRSPQGLMNAADAQETLRETVHPEDRSRVFAAWDDSHHLTGKFDAEFRVVRPDGEVRWVRGRTFPIHNSDGSVRAIAGLTEDITATHHGRELLRLQRDLNGRLGSLTELEPALGSLIESAMEIGTLDCGGAYLRDERSGDLHLVTHRGLSASFVAAASHFTPDSVQSAMVAVGRPTYLDSLEGGLTSQDFFVREGLRALAVLPLRHQDRIIGALNLASHTASVIPPSVRTLVEVLASAAQGAIGRIRAEEARRQSEARLRAVVTAAPIALFALDREGRILFQAGQVLGQPGPDPEPRVGQPVMESLASHPAIVEGLQRALAGRDHSAPLDLFDRHHECHFKPLLDAAGKPIGVIGVAADISDRVRLERQILFVSDSEQARIGQDIHDGLCQELVSAGFDVAALEQQLVERGLPEAAAARRLGDLLDQITTHARQVSRGLYPVKLESGGLASALIELAANCSNARTCCQFENPEGVLVANHATSMHLFRITQEAVNNALRHGQATEVSVRLLPRPEGASLIITDNGHGIPQPPPRQSGMGLHTMEYRARSFGGAIEIRRTSHGGTSVICFIPRAAL